MGVRTGYPESKVFIPNCPRTFTFPTGGDPFFVAKAHHILHNFTIASWVFVEGCGPTPATAQKELGKRSKRYFFCWVFGPEFQPGGKKDQLLYPIVVKQESHQCLVLFGAFSCHNCTSKQTPNCLEVSNTWISIQIYACLPRRQIQAWDPELISRRHSLIDIQ